MYPPDIRRVSSWDLQADSDPSLKTLCPFVDTYEGCASKISNAFR